MKHVRIIEHYKTYDLIAEDGWWVTDDCKGNRYPIVIHKYTIPKEELHKWHEIDDEDMYRIRERLQKESIAYFRNNRTFRQE